MTEAFDPYRKWLGIPPEHQPPHHYRLLGIELFESDRQLNRQEEAQSQSAAPESVIPEFQTVRASSYLPRTRGKQSRWTIPIALTACAVVFIASVPETAAIVTDPQQRGGEQSDNEATEPAASQKKPAIPDAEQQQATEKKIRDIFSKEFASAKTPDQELGLAKKLLQQAGETHDDPVAKFVLLRLACDLMATAGEPREAFSAVDTLQAEFDIAGLAMKADLLAKTVDANRGGAREAVNWLAVVEAAATLIDEASAADDFETATHAGKLATAAARNAKEPQIVREVAARQREVDRLKTKFIAIKKAKDTLENSPADPEANLIVGQWYCFAKKDWERGLPLLTKGPDEKLAELARQDLASPTDAKARTFVADAWWEAAESERAPAKSPFRDRAVHWYGKTLTELSGLEKAKAEKRIETAESDAFEALAAASKTRAAMAKGNVALASNGATVTGPVKKPEQLLDGNTTAYDGSKGFATATPSKPFDVVLAKTYQLREIRVLLWDKRPRSYNYSISTSADGVEFAPLVDRSDGVWTGWQRCIINPPRPVKVIRFMPLQKVYLETMKAGSDFTIVEIEAYCVSPAR